MEKVYFDSHLRWRGYKWREWSRLWCKRGVALRKGWRNCDDGYYVGSKGIIRRRGAGVMLCQRALLERTSSAGNEPNRANFGTLATSTRSRCRRRRRCRHRRRGPTKWWLIKNIISRVVRKHVFGYSYRTLMYREIVILLNIFFRSSLSSR